MKNYIFVAHGDVTQLTADAVVFSTDTNYSKEVRGLLLPAFQAIGRGFPGRFDELQKREDCSLGDVQWLPLDGETRPHGVLVVATVWYESPASAPSLTNDQETELVVQRAIRAAFDRVRERKKEGRHLLIALPALRLGTGGEADKVASARVQVRTARQVLEDLPDDTVDVAFITYTRNTYQVFLHARCQELHEPVCPVKEEDVAPLLQAVHENRCVPFIGAGLSAGADFPDWKQLLDEINAQLPGEIPPPGISGLERDLWPADRYTEVHRRVELHRLVHRRFCRPDLQPTLAHYLLLASPLRTVVTTNYDDLLERALRAVRFRPDTIIEEGDVVRTGQGHGVCVVKFHGDARTQRHLVVTWDDYQCYFPRRPAMDLLLRGLLLNQTFLFLGYGLRDPNFLQIYRHIADILRDAQRPAYTLPVRPPTPEQRHRLEGLGPLHMVPLSAGNAEEGAHNLARFLDWLAFQHVGRQYTLAPSAPGGGSPPVFSPDLLLTGGTTLPDSVHGLVDSLQEVGEALVQRIYAGSFSPEETHVLADVLEFLADHGWRYEPAGTYPLWWMLINATDNHALQRRLLLKALRRTGDLDQVQEIHQRLDQLGPA